MTYTNITSNDFVMIEAYFNISAPVLKMAKVLERSRQTIYNVYHFLSKWKTALDYYKQYKKIKKDGVGPCLFYPTSKGIRSKHGCSRVDP